MAATLAASACALAVLASCAKYDPGTAASSTSSGTVSSSSASNSSSDVASPTSSTSTPSGSGTPKHVTYTTALPTGPDTLGGPGGAENTVYQELQRNDCAGAQLQLDGQGHNGFDSSWMSMESPSYVLVFQAAISACEGKLTKAARWFSRGKRVVGLTGIQTSITPTPCYLYKALVSVFSQIPRHAVACPGGTPAPWPTDADGATVKADPRRDPYPPPPSPSASTSSSDSSSPDASSSQSSG